MWLVGALSRDPKCTGDVTASTEICLAGRDPYLGIQIAFSVLGCLWIYLLGKRVRILQDLPENAWRTHLSDAQHTVYDEELLLSSVEVELGAQNEVSNKRK